MTNNTLRFDSFLPAVLTGWALESLSPSHLAVCLSHAIQTRREFKDFFAFSLFTLVIGGWFVFVSPIFGCLQLSFSSIFAVCLNTILNAFWLSYR
jgi:hypothetical protein